MIVPVKGAALLIASTLLSGCLATKGALEKAVTEQRAALDAERTERVAADERLAADLAQLRTDLQAMRNEFGAKISAVEQGLAFAMPVHFAFDDATVQSTDNAALDRFADIVTKHYTGAVVTVEGFADPAGSRAYNKKLSTERAEAVRSYLMTRNITAQVRTIGYGEDRLVVKDAAKNEPGAELNRRVVFVIESPKAQATQMTALDN
ncbi:MAG TPA: OmpA family protein [Longimicrobiales bacterium]